MSLGPVESVRCGSGMIPLRRIGFHTQYKDHARKAGKQQIHADHGSAEAKRRFTRSDDLEWECLGVDLGSIVPAYWSVQIKLSFRRQRYFFSSIFCLLMINTQSPVPGEV